MFSSQQSACWRCGALGDHLLHIFWLCNKITPFWNAIQKYLPKFTDQQLPDDPAFYLLHCNSLPISVYKASLLPHLLNAARNCIAESWKQIQLPSLARWLLKVNDIQRMEELLALDEVSKDKFGNCWFHWSDFQSTPEYADDLVAI